MRPGQGAIDSVIDAGKLNYEGKTKNTWWVGAQLLCKRPPGSEHLMKQTLSSGSRLLLHQLCAGPGMPGVWRIELLCVDMCVARCW